MINGTGLEIGGPSDVFRVIYNSSYVCDGVNYATKTVWGYDRGGQYKWKNKILGIQIIAEATDLKLIPDEKYDFVLSSNSLEHIANSIMAIEEFIRVLKNGKILIILVPCKEFTFDHILEDYKKVFQKMI